MDLKVTCNLERHLLGNPLEREWSTNETSNTDVLLSFFFQNFFVNFVKQGRETTLGGGGITYPCLLRMLWACCSMNRSPGDAPCLGEEREGCLLSLGELGGIPVIE